MREPAGVPSKMHLGKLSLGHSGRGQNDEDETHAASAQGHEEHFATRSARLDGGVAAWTQVGMAFLVVFSTQGYFNSFGVFQSYYDMSLSHAGPSAVSWIGSVQVWLVFGLGTVSGRAVDAGRFHTVYIIGCFLQLAGIFIASLAKEYWQVFLSHGVCVGLGAGLMFAPTLAVLTSYFLTRRSTALALTTCGGASGGAFFPLLVHHLIPRVGLSWTLRTVGFIMTATLLGALALSRPRVTRQNSKQTFSFGVLKDTSYALFAVSSFFCFWALYFGYYYKQLSAYARDELNFSYVESTMIVLELNVVGIPIRLLVAYLADRHVHPQDVFLCSLFGAAVTLFCWIPVRTSTGIYVLTAFYGVVAGAIQTLFLAVASSFVTDHNVAGVYIGLVCTVVSFAALTGPPVGGAIVGQHGRTYMNGEIWSGLSMMLSFFVLLLSRVRQRAV
ncbi:uncharacterized protein PV09_03549 [Verruconis gallopava]|uniref:Major facilitator superfamily (MFS) profile domain-containing protein n=1 Tax=Verruconis gallopava TaxID=253628 RepID=A0A0D1YYA6_9PEZI|nr:uncharacterized protein PV09_03549 [Verruconis gallopava]KIW05687.1 hypothetical protein PV09_03549 [Verruconis gallopava]